MSSSKKTTTTQWTDPYKPAAPGIQAATRLATEGLNSATPYQGRFNPQTSSYTQAGVEGLKNLADYVPAGYGRSALDAGDYLANKIYSGGYKPPTYDPAAAIESAVRPVTERYSEQLIPNMNAMFTANGAYQGGAPGGSSNLVGQQLSRDFNREAIQVAGEQAFNAAQLNSQNMIQSNQQEMSAIGGLPGVYAGGAAAAGIPSGLQAQAGAGEEALAGRDIMEALQQNQYGNMYEAGVAGPYLDLLMGPGEAFGTTTNITKQKLDPLTQALGLGLAAAGAAFGGPAGAQPGLAMAAGGATGAPANILPGGSQSNYGGYGAIPSGYQYMNPFGGGSSTGTPWAIY